MLFFDWWRVAEGFIAVVLFLAGAWSLRFASRISRRMLRLGAGLAGADLVLLGSLFGLLLLAVSGCRATRLLAIRHREQWHCALRTLTREQPAEAVQSCFSGRMDYAKKLSIGVQLVPWSQSTSIGSAIQACPSITRLVSATTD